ncbi:hypothetical protein FSW04_01940 [Baekduia soli]|uniref:Secreted protein n=1 Tax=Baekduia soli TaxID=496014 RepID=A0A5B8U0G4_9ACTN|nr:hypothetical protein [Baekduia soli]QEC46460.1 hypothetical protein FSW04_01940 [Baekduia soli]
MSVTARLAGFAAVLALVFGATMAVGSVAGTKPGRATEPPAMTGMAAGHGAAEAPRGLGVADDGLRLVTEGPATRRPGETRPFTFRIVDRDGATVRDFDVEHTKRLHLIAVRRDLTGYQHLHPVQTPDGSWSVPLGFAEAGVYRVYADFTAHGREKTTLATDVFVPGDFRPRPLPAPATHVAADGYDITLEGTPRAGAEGDLRFSVSKDGRPVAVQPYLGADGHLVALREGDLAYLHVHPQESPGSGGPIRFMTEYPSAGRYRLFLQFRHDGVVHTAAFTQVVR